ncbi:hypothetical protein [Microbacterium tenebrionis]|nr:hypothetical protein [Microbacterium tenebrionis]
MKMTTDDLPHRGAEWEVIAISRTSLRICDPARSVSDASRLIAYVDRTDIGTYDVLWLRSPCPPRSRYRTLNELLAELDEAVSGGSASRADRPTRIAHHPPRY